MCELLRISVPALDDEGLGESCDHEGTPGDRRARGQATHGARQDHHGQHQQHADGPPHRDDRHSIIDGEP